MTSPNPDEDNNVPGNNPPESNLDDSFDAFDSFFDDAEEGAAEETVESLREERDALKKQAEESVNALTYITDSNVKTRAALETIREKTRKDLKVLKDAHAAEDKAEIASFITTLLPVIDTMALDLAEARKADAAAVADGFEKTMVKLKDTFNKFVPREATAPAATAEEAAGEKTETTQKADVTAVLETPKAEDTIESLHAEKSALMKKIAGLTTLLAKAQTDQQKLRKEQQSLKDEAVRILRREQEDHDAKKGLAIEKPLKEIIGVIDTIEIGLTHAKKAGALKTAEGLEKTLSAITDVFNKFGVRAIDPKGQPFDEKKHEVMSVIAASAETPTDTVAQVLQKGYEINGRVVRYARVFVAE